MSILSDVGHNENWIFVKFRRLFKMIKLFGWKIKMSTCRSNVLSTCR